MKVICCTVCLAALALLMPTKARAGSPHRGSTFASGFYGGIGNFFNPYSFSSSTSVSTPPYFAVHPPVYYSTRHARPYGMSPFAAPPMVAPPSGYQGRLRSEFVRPPVIENPFCDTPCKGSDDPREGAEEIAVPGQPVQASAATRGPVRENPFAAAPPQLAHRR